MCVCMYVCIISRVRQVPYGPCSPKVHMYSTPYVCTYQEMFVFGESTLVFVSLLVQTLMCLLSFSSIVCTIHTYAVYCASTLDRWRSMIFWMERISRVVELVSCMYVHVPPYPVEYPYTYNGWDLRTRALLPTPEPPTPWSSRCQNRTNCSGKMKACMHQIISPWLFHGSKQSWSGLA